MDARTEVYKKKPIKALSFGKSLAAQDISAAIERSLPLTNRVLAAMVSEGTLLETGLAQSTGGRRPVTYSLAPDVAYVLSVAMDQYVTKVSFLDISEMRVRGLKKYDLPLPKNEKALDELVELLQEYITHAEFNKQNLVGIGIGMPGFVDVKKGINYSYLSVSGNKLSLAEYIENEIDIPVFLDNDSSTIALTEHMLGHASGKRNSLVINFGWGVGLGMILNGKWFRGSNGFAGEFSHIALFNNNKLCGCGKSGCLETEASRLTIVNDFRSALESGRASAVETLPDDMEQASDRVIEAVLSGDQLAVELFTQAAYDIGRGIAILIHILNPEQIIISGRGAAARPVILAPIQQAISKFCIPRLASYTEVILSQLTKDSEIYGAAALVTENMGKKKTNLLRKISETH